MKFLVDSHGNNVVKTVRFMENKSDNNDNKSVGRKYYIVSKFDRCDGMESVYNLILSKFRNRIKTRLMSVTYFNYDFETTDTRKKLISTIERVCSRCLHGGSYFEWLVDKLLNRLMTGIGYYYRDGVSFRASVVDYNSVNNDHFESVKKLQLPYNADHHKFSRVLIDEFLRRNTLLTQIVLSYVCNDDGDIACVLVDKNSVDQNVDVNFDAWCDHIVDYFFQHDVCLGFTPYEYMGNVKSKSEGPCWNPRLGNNGYDMSEHYVYHHKHKKDATNYYVAKTFFNDYINLYRTYVNTYLYMCNCLQCGKRRIDPIDSCFRDFSDEYLLVDLTCVLLHIFSHTSVLRGLNSPLYKNVDKISGFDKFIDELMIFYCNSILFGKNSMWDSNHMYLSADEYCQYFHYVPYQCSYAVCLFSSLTFLDNAFGHNIESLLFRFKRHACIVNITDELKILKDFGESVDDMNLLDLFKDGLFGQIESDLIKYPLVVITNDDGFGALSVANKDFCNSNYIVGNAKLFRDSYHLYCNLLGQLDLINKHNHYFYDTGITYNPWVNSVFGEFDYYAKSDSEFDESPERCVAVKSLCGHRVSILTGYAGVGKTHFVGKYASAVQHACMKINNNHKLIQGISMSNRATDMLRNSLNDEQSLEVNDDGTSTFDCYTITRFVNVILGRGARNPIKAESLKQDLIEDLRNTCLFIIDEFSMPSEQDLALIFSKLREYNVDCQILFVGDIEQLPTFTGSSLCYDLHAIHAVDKHADNDSEASVFNSRLGFYRLTKQYRSRHTNNLASKFVTLMRADNAGTIYDLKAILDKARDCIDSDFHYNDESNGRLNTLSTCVSSYASYLDNLSNNNFDDLSDAFAQSLIIASTHKEVDYLNYSMSAFVKRKVLTNNYNDSDIIGFKTSSKHCPVCELGDDDFNSRLYMSVGDVVMIGNGYDSRFHKGVRYQIIDIDSTQFDQNNCEDSVLCDDTVLSNGRVARYLDLYKLYKHLSCGKIVVTFLNLDTNETIDCVLSNSNNCKLFYDLANMFKFGYAATVHVSQGSTYNDIFYCLTQAIDYSFNSRQMVYVAMTRHADNLYMFVNRRNRNWYQNVKSSTKSSYYGYRMWFSLFSNTPESISDFNKSSAVNQQGIN